MPTDSNKMRHRYRGHSVLHFRFSQKVMQNQVAKALLWVWVRGSGRKGCPPPRDRDSSESEDPEDPEDADELPDEDDEEESASYPREAITISVQRMKREGPPFETEAKTELLQPDGEGAWVQINVKKMVEDWFRRPRDNMGLMVHANPQHLINLDLNDEQNTNVSC